MIQRAYIHVLYNMLNKTVMFINIFHFVLKDVTCSPYLFTLVVTWLQWIGVESFELHVFIDDAATQPKLVWLG